MKLIGLMSGTSVDSIDAACVEIDGLPGEHDIRLVEYCSQPWDPELRAAILSLSRSNAQLQQVTALNFLVGEAFALAGIAAAAVAGWDLSLVDAIASHGQTVWHQPDPCLIDETGLNSVGTMQIGEPAVIAARTGCTVVADFRAADMAVGGQGAPLVPFMDYVLFTDTRETRAVQNIGGIGNVTYLRAGGSLADVIAFDTGPGNVLMDGLVRHISGKECDLDGEMAARGQVCLPVLHSLLDHPFFAIRPPKSTGRELFGEEMVLRILQEGRDMCLSDYDLMATACALTVESISMAYGRYLDTVSKVECVVLGGGGIHNKTLVSKLTRALAPARVTTHEEFGVNSDAKEAIAFALLAYETLNGRPSNVPSATGARCPAILGKVVTPHK